MLLVDSNCYCLVEGLPPGAWNRVVVVVVVQVVANMSHDLFRLEECLAFLLCSGRRRHCLLHHFPGSLYRFADSESLLLLLLLLLPLPDDQANQAVEFPHKFQL